MMTIAPPTACHGRTGFGEKYRLKKVRPVTAFDPSKGR
jgi:hypothetical protein